MKVLKTALTEIYGLFVEDGSYAVAIILWLLFAALVLPHLPLSPPLRGPILFVGMAAILLESVLRASRKRC